MLHAMLSREAGERMVVVVDSEYIFKAITVWTDKWKRHGWRTSSGEVGHRDLWEHIDWLRGEAGDKLQVRWVPSHLGVCPKISITVVPEPNSVPCLHPTADAFRRAIRIHYDPPLT